MNDFDKELARIDATRRGDPLTAEDIARIRAQERRWATESRIRSEEWAKATGFPYWPRWVIPAALLAAPAAGAALASLIIALLLRMH